MIGYFPFIAVRFHGLHPELLPVVQYGRGLKNEFK